MSTRTRRACHDGMKSRRGQALMELFNRHFGGDQSVWRDVTQTLFMPRMVIYFSKLNGRLFIG